jgi:hypothetical protein
VRPLALKVLPIWARPNLPMLRLLGLLMLALVVTSCGASKRQKTLHGALVSMNLARDGFTIWDADHQKTIVEKATSREEGERELAAYRLKRTPVVAGFEVAYRVLALAATQTDDPSLKAALAASAELLAAIKSITGGP